MFLPDTVLAVQLVGSNGRGDVATAGFGWELRRPVGVLHLFYVLLSHADEADCNTIVQLAIGCLCRSRIEGPSRREVRGYDAV